MRNLSGLQNFVDGASLNSLKNAKNRKIFAKNLCNLLHYGNLAQMLAFVEEMRGLNFYRSEDRAVFCEFVFCWIKEDANESSYT